MSGTETESAGKLDEAKAQAQEQAQQVADQARGRARSMVDERSTQAGERIGEQVTDVRAVADQLREQGKDGPAKVATQAADRADRLGSYLRESDADRILGDVERMARQNPWAVIAGGVAVGFVASRFLKASSRERYRSASASSGGRPELPRTTAPTASAGAGSLGAPSPASAAAPVSPPKSAVGSL
jgi:hypothetical protein